MRDQRNNRLLLRFSHYATCRTSASILYERRTGARDADLSARPAKLIGYEIH